MDWLRSQPVGLCRHSWLGFLHGDVLLFKESEKDDIRFQKW